MYHRERAGAGGSGAAGRRYETLAEGARLVGRMPIARLYGPSPAELARDAGLGESVIERDAAGDLRREIRTQAGVMIEQEARRRARLARG